MQQLVPLVISVVLIVKNKDVVKCGECVTGHRKNTYSCIYICYTKMSHEFCTQTSKKVESISICLGWSVIFKRARVIVFAALTVI